MVVSTVIWSPMLLVDKSSHSQLSWMYAMMNLQHVAEARLIRL